MKKISFKKPAIFITYILGILIGISSSVSPFTGSTSLNTKKIDSNIEKLKPFAWFMNLYEDERYRRSFFANKKIRAYLQSSFKVNNLIKDEKAQKRFISLLEKQAQLREK
ncbi:nitrite reductase [Planococcus halotolerans]|uniref:Nitrite reductase n=1 Tax=Planococcus halotolerans TaxID=2233542 RepID=A0A365L784_9BACL|nr:nitrite reductase [Planococcus halotolerans]RAZ81268.1 nitrite reductase [Planococcus halotolerans]